VKFLYPISKWNNYEWRDFSWFRFVDNKLVSTNARSCGKFLGYDYKNEILKYKLSQDWNIKFRTVLNEFERDVNEIRKSSNHKN